MSERTWLAERFEAERSRLRGAAYRMLGSLDEADDAVQETWLRLDRTDATTIDNLGGWLTTVVARVCLDRLRSRKARREEPPEPDAPHPTASDDPEREALLADAVGVALLVVLETLEPAERLAFVLHDTFDVPFDEIAAVVGRSTAATRQLASRARRRVRGTPAVAGADLSNNRAVVDAFLAALRAGDVEALVAVLDPDVVVRAEGREVRGARAWAQGAVAFKRFGRFLQSALVDGEVGVVMAPNGRLSRVLTFEIAGGKVARVEVVSDPERLGRLDLAVLPD